MNRRQFLATLPPLVSGVGLASCSSPKQEIQSASILTWVIVDHPPVTKWMPQEGQFLVRAANRSAANRSPVAFVPFGLASTRQAVFYGHLQPGSYQITAQVEPDTVPVAAGTDPIVWAGERAVVVEPGYSASVRINVDQKRRSSTIVIVDQQSFTIDDEVSAFALLLADFPNRDSMESVAKDMSKVLAELEITTTSELGSTISGERFFLFDGSSEAVIRACSHFRNSERSKAAYGGRVAVGVVGRDPEMRDSLIVVGPASAMPMWGLDNGMRGRTPGRSVREPEYDKRILNVRRLTGALAFYFGDNGGAVRAIKVSEEVDEVALSRKVAALAPTAIDVAKRFSEAFDRASEIRRARGEAPLPSEFCVASLEDGVVKVDHNLVDAANLREVQLSAGVLKSCKGGTRVQANCSPGDIPHATAVYGIMSALVPTLRRNGNAASEVTCAPGLLTGIKHLAVSVPEPLESNVDPHLISREFAKQLGDLLRWMTGVPVRHRIHAGWPTLEEVGTPPARVVNISRRFSSIGAGANADTGAWQELADALHDVTTVAFGGKGAVVVLVADNEGTLISEEELALPCRNSVLVATGIDAECTSADRPSVNVGPPISVCAWRSNAQLLSARKNELCHIQAGTYTSYAAPVVAATAALVALAKPSLSAAQIATVVKESACVVDAERVGVGRWIALSKDRTVLLEWGSATTRSPMDGQQSFEKDKHWFSLWYGHGVVDPVGAVNRAVQL